MTSELRLRPCARLACDARLNHSRTDSSCCDGNSRVKPLVKELQVDDSQRNVSQPSLKLIRHNLLHAQEYKIPSPNGKPLLSERSASARRCLRLGCLRAVPHPFLSCPRSMIRPRLAQSHVSPPQRSFRRGPVLASNGRAPALRLP